MQPIFDGDATDFDYVARHGLLRLGASHRLRDRSGSLLGAIGILVAEPVALLLSLPHSMLPPSCRMRPAISCAEVSQILHTDPAVDLVDETESAERKRRQQTSRTFAAMLQSSASWQCYDERALRNLLNESQMITAIDDLAGSRLKMALQRQDLFAPNVVFGCQHSPAMNRVHRFGLGVGGLVLDYSAQPPLQFIPETLCDFEGDWALEHDDVVGRAHNQPTAFQDTLIDAASSFFSLHGAYPPLSGCLINGEYAPHSPTLITTNYDWLLESGNLGPVLAARENVGHELAALTERYGSLDDFPADANGIAADWLIDTPPGCQGADDAEQNSFDGCTVLTWQSPIASAESHWLVEKIALLQSAFGTLSRIAAVILRRRKTPGFLQDVALIQSAWYLLHGTHPPELRRRLSALRA